MVSAGQQLSAMPATASHSPHPLPGLSPARPPRVAPLPPACDSGVPLLSGPCNSITGVIRVTIDPRPLLSASQLAVQPSPPPATVSAPACTLIQSVLLTRLSNKATQPTPQHKKKSL